MANRRKRLGKKLNGVYSYLWRKLFNPNSFIVTLLIFVFLWVFHLVQVNMHFLDPFNYGIRDYQITDIIYSQFRDPRQIRLIDEVVLVNSDLMPRDSLPLLLRRLRQLGPKVIGLDILLEDQGDDEVIDSLLREEIRQTPNLVLAGALGPYIDSLQRFPPLAGCHPYFREAAANMGYINFVSKDTSTIRLFSPQEKTTDGVVRSFAVKIATLYDPSKVTRLLRRQNKVESINYAGDRDFFVKIQPFQLFDDEYFQLLLDRDMLKDRIALVGFVGSHAPGEREIDRFFTPLNRHYSGKTYPDMYGVVIHANIIDMILREEYIFFFFYWLTEFLVWIYCYFNVLIIHRIYRKLPETFHGVTRLMQITEFVVIFFVIAFLFYYFRIKIDFSKGILAMVLAYDFVMIYESMLKKKFKFLQNLPEK